MWAGFVDALIEGHVGAAQRVQSQCADHVGCIHQDFCREQCQRSHGQHRLGAIDQRDGFFGFKYQRRDLSTAQRIRTWDPVSFFVEAFPFTNKCERQVCKRRKIAAGSYAALRGNEWRDSPVQHFAERIDYCRTNARMAFGKELARSAIMARTSADGSGSPTPTAWERTRLT